MFYYFFDGDKDDNTSYGFIIQLLNRLADLVGFGVAVATGMQYLEHFPERTYKSMMVPLMLEDKRTGTSIVLFIYKWNV